jgi:hypothetical protein
VGRGILSIANRTLAARQPGTGSGDRRASLPLYVDGTLLISFVFNRMDHDFDDRERDLPGRMRPPLASLFRASVAPAEMRAARTRSAAIAGDRAT